MEDFLDRKPLRLTGPARLISELRNLVFFAGILLGKAAPGSLLRVDHAPGDRVLPQTIRRTPPTLESYHSSLDARGSSTRQVFAEVGLGGAARCVIFSAVKMHTVPTVPYYRTRGVRACRSPRREQTKPRHARFHQRFALLARVRAHIRAHTK